MHYDTVALLDTTAIDIIICVTVTGTATGTLSIIDVSGICATTAWKAVEVGWSKRKSHDSYFEKIETEKQPGINTFSLVNIDGSPAKRAIQKNFKILESILVIVFFWIERKYSLPENQQLAVLRKANIFYV